MKSTQEIFPNRKRNTVHLEQKRLTPPLLTEFFLLKLLPYVVLEDPPLLLLALQVGEEQNPVLILKVVLHTLLKTEPIIHHYKSHDRVMKVSVLCEQAEHNDLDKNGM